MRVCGLALVLLVGANVVAGSPDRAADPGTGSQGSPSQRVRLAETLGRGRGHFAANAKPAGPVLPVLPAVSPPFAVSRLPATGGFARPAYNRKGSRGVPHGALPPYRAAGVPSNFPFQPVAEGPDAMDEQPLDVERTEIVAEPAPTSPRPKPSRKKVAIVAGICVAIWIVAMLIQGSGESEADAGKDKMGRNTGGISVERRDEPSPAKSPADKPKDRNEKPSYAELLKKIDDWDATVWAKEVEAQRYEAALVKVWDDVRAADDKFAALERALPPAVYLGTLGGAEDVGIGIRQVKIAEPKKAYTADGTAAAFQGAANAGRAPATIDGAYSKLFAGFRAAGYVVEQIELRHLEFALASDAGPARSTVGLTLDAHGPQGKRRVTIRGNVLVEWSAQPGDAGSPIAATLDASQLTLTVRDAPPAFTEALAVEEAPKTEVDKRFYRRPWPILLTDLTGDGLPELLLGGRNLLYPNLGGGKFGNPRPISPSMPRIAHAGLAADFSGDGKRDFLAVDNENRLILFSGDGQGGFSPGERAAEVVFRLPMALTAGDIDGDGDLDVFVGQYKRVWLGGQMATPYYDANDGDPAYLLRNDGGKFTDITEAAGLAAKRNRRTNSASLVDLTGDGNLDLLVCSEYAGVDLYRGDGRGRFEDVTATMLGEDRRGMSAAHALADFDADGRLDFFVASERSHAARRLEKLGIGRGDMPEHTKMRPAMSYGNRMFLARDGNFESSPFADQIADAGGPRACVALDVENDGDVDLFVVNGGQSGKTAADVGSRVWRHAIYLGSSASDDAHGLLFSHLFTDALGRGESYHGFEHNALFLDRGDRGYVDAAYALGVASQRDGRSTIAGDFDADGRVDLIVVDQTFVDNFPHEAVYVLRNTLETPGHWIGVRLLRSPSGHSPIGSQVTLVAAGKRRVAVVATGDSFAAQLGPVVHFGLGTTSAVEKLEIRWPDGKVDTLANPGVDRYHDVGTR